MSLASQVSLLGTAIAGEIKRVRQDMGSSQDKTRALRTWYTALQAAATAPADVFWIGASVEEGYGASLISNQYVNVFREEIRRINQPAGIPGGFNYYGFNAYQKYPTGTYTDTPITAASGTISASVAGGLGLRAIVVFLSASFTLTFYGTGADLVYATDTTFGSFAYSVDGGGATTQATNAAASNGNRVTIRGLTRGTHTLTVTCTVGGSANAVAMEGAVFYDGDEAAGIRVWQGAHAGYKAQDFAGTTAWVNSLQTWNFPALVVIALGPNDYTNSRTSAQVKADLLTIIGLLRSRATTLSKTSPSFILSSLYEISAGTMVEPWANYVTKMNEISTSENDVTLVDYQRLFGPEVNNVRGGLINSDFIHPTDAGYGLLGAAMSRFASPDDGVGRFGDMATLSTPQSFVGQKSFLTLPPIFGVAQRLLAISTPTLSPPAGYFDWYIKSDGRLYSKNSSGVEALVSNSVAVCTSGARPTGFAGLIIYETDTKNALIYDGVAASYKYLGNKAIVTSSTRPTGGLLQDGLQIWETDTKRSYVYNSTSSTWIFIGSDAAGQKIIGLGTPTLSTDAATKNYVDSQITAIASVGQEMGYAERTTNFTTTNITLWSVAAGSVISSLSVVVTGTGRQVRIDFSTPGITHSATTIVTTYLIVNGATNSANSQYQNYAVAAGQGGIMSKRLILTNTVSYTFTIGIAGAAAGTSTVSGGTSGPMFIAVTKV